MEYANKLLSGGSVGSNFEPMPAEFTLCESETDHRCVLIFRSCKYMKYTMLTLVALWIAGCTFFSYKIIVTEDVPQLLIIVNLVFWLFGLFVGYSIVYELYSHIVFDFSRDILTIKHSLWILTWTNSFLRSDIVSIEQIKSTGDNDDLGDTWAIVIVTNRRTKIFEYQPIQVSRWAGVLLAQWAGVQFRE